MHPTERYFDVYLPRRKFKSFEKFLEQIWNDVVKPAENGICYAIIVVDTIFAFALHFWDLLY